MEQTVVSSYVRSNKREANTEPENTNNMTYVMLAGTVLVLAIAYPVVMALGLVGAAVWGLTKIPAPTASVEVVAAPAPLEAVEIPKPKRHYKHRLTVNTMVGNKIKTIKV